MSNLYKQISNFGTESHFSAAVTGELAFSRMTSTPQHLTTFNAGDIVPLYCLEVLPHDTISMSSDFVVRQTTVLTPTMGSMEIDIYAFFVPNRVVNESWKSVMGENVNGSWTAPEITLAPLFDPQISPSVSTVQVPVGSVADYYGFPTQQPLPVTVLSQCHDLKFRGYVEIYNEYFRDQNYQPPIPYSKLNVYEDFLHLSSDYTLGRITTAMDQDDSYGSGALGQAIYGNMDSVGTSTIRVNNSSSFNILAVPLKANKLHDQFTSVLPTPQKGSDILVPLAGMAPVVTSDVNVFNSVDPLRWRFLDGTAPITAGAYNLVTTVPPSSGNLSASTNLGSLSQTSNESLVPANLWADLNAVPSVTIAELRTAAAVQQVYEQLARSGSRYREYIRAFFGLEVDNPYKDIPTYLGHIRRNLDLYQTAQTSSSVEGSTAQGNLAAFGYTANGGNLFTTTFLEHGYIHILGVVRHKNVYSSFMARDNFRLNMLDWYQPPLANISEQPVYTREINPFYTKSDQVFGYQEPWYEYRYDPDYVSGYLRPGVENSLSLWTYADDFDSALAISTGKWLQSNSREVLDRTLAITSSLAPQLKGQFKFVIDKERPMPTYSVPGLDIF